MNNGLPCPSCNAEAFYRGRIPDAIHFAGRAWEEPVGGGSLYACTHCHLNFRHPRPTTATLDSLYVHGKSDNWQYLPEERVDWILTKHTLESAPVDRTILDVGCFDGGFLRFLGPRWQCYGVEIHPEAARRAESYGIEILCDNLAKLGQVDRRFGCVTAMDVLEHVEDPLRLLKDLSRLTQKDGLLIVSSGNTEARSWKLLGSRYWYCVIGEHISFINPQWCDNAAKVLGLTVTKIASFSHAGDSGHLHRVWQAFLNGTYALLPGLVALARSLGLGGIDARKHKSLRYHPPGWMTARDHFLVCFRKT